MVAPCITPCNTPLWCSIPFYARHWNPCCPIFLENKRLAYHFMAYLQFGINSETLWCILWVWGIILAKKLRPAAPPFGHYFPMSGCNLLDSLAMASSTVSRNVLLLREFRQLDKVGLLKGFEEALGGGGGADVEIDIIAEQLIASSFHLCAVHHFLGHYNGFFFSVARFLQ